MNMLSFFTANQAEEGSDAADVEPRGIFGIPSLLFQQAFFKCMNRTKARPSGTEQ